MAKHIDRRLTCEDCIHYVICIFHHYGDENKKCPHFKNKADVEIALHGKWLPDYETFVDEWERESEPIQTGWVCSKCGRYEFEKEPYCHCGAKMDRKGEQ